jgi:amino acid permease
MLIEFQILLLILAFIFFFLAFFMHGKTNSEIVWVVSVVLFGVMMVASLNVQMLVPVYNETLSAYVTQPYHYQNYAFGGISFMFFSLSIIGAYIDFFEKFGKKG